MRTIVYVDGFNFFYALKDVRKQFGKCYYWLDVYSFARSLVTSPPFGDRADTLEALHYFTAVPAKDPAQKLQHLHFFQMSQAIGSVTVHDGVHIPKHRQCKVEQGCGGSWKDFEEKETDVRLGIKMVADAYDDKFDRAVLISQDGDFVPVLEHVRLRFPNKQIGLVTPLGRWPNKKLAGYAHTIYTLIETDLEPHLLPETVYGANGKEYLRPAGWVHDSI